MNFFVIRLSRTPNNMIKKVYGNLSGTRQASLLGAARQERSGSMYLKIPE